MIGAVIFVVVAIAIVYAIGRRTGARIVSPNAVLRRLELPGSEYSFRMTALTWAWNPAGNATYGQFVFGKGPATYWLDEAGLVHLRYQPDRGGERHLTGPKPPYSPKQRVATIVAIGVLAAVVMLIAGGALIGYHAAAPGSGHRDDGAAIGASVAVVAACALASVTRLVVGARATRRGGR